MIIKYEVVKEPKIESIKAQFGTIKPGDYAVVVSTTRGMRGILSVGTDVGVVGDDGWVYMGGYAKRKIGSEGCPICKISPKDVDPTIRRILANALKLAKEKSDGIIKRKLPIRIKVTTKLLGATISQVMYASVEYKKNPNDRDKEDLQIQSQVEKILSRYFSNDMIRENLRYQYMNNVGKDDQYYAYNQDIINSLDYNTTLTITSMNPIEVGERPTSGQSVVYVRYIPDHEDWCNYVIVDGNGNFVGPAYGQKCALAYIKD